MCYEYKQLKYIPTLSIGWLVGIWGSDLSRDAQAFLSSSHILWVFWGIPRCFQASRQRDLISLACPGSTLGSPLGSNCGKHFTYEASRGHVLEMPEPTQWLLSAFRTSSALLNDQTPHPVSNDEPRHRSREVYFFCLYLRIHLAMINSSSR